MTHHTYLFHSLSVLFCSFFFFFQAEDGIRDLTVTGVQTCALPISGRQRWRLKSRGPRPPRQQFVTTRSHWRNAAVVLPATTRYSLHRAHTRLEAAMGLRAALSTTLAAIVLACAFTPADADDDRARP